jgi:hypothetical protein
MIQTIPAAPNHTFPPTQTTLTTIREQMHLTLTVPIQATARLLDTTVWEATLTYLTTITVEVDMAEADMEDLEDLEAEAIDQVEADF